MGARTGQEFLEGLKKRKREIYLGNERVDDVTSHPELVGGARTMADLFDLQHQYPDELLIPDDETGEPIGIAHMMPRSKEDLQRRRKGLERIHRFTLGHMGRSPDYNSICFAGFAGQPDVWAGKDGKNAEGAENLVNYQKYLRRNDISTTHTLIHPTIDKSREHLIVGTEHGLHKVGETKDSIILRGARVLATLAPFADELVVWTGQPIIQPDAQDYALSFGIPMDSPGLIFICRDSAERVNANPFDHPLSGRFDEQDAFAIFNDVEVPKSRVFNAGHADIYNTIGATGFFPNMQQQTTIRALTKLEFAYGLGAKMAEIINDTSDATQEMLGEILHYIELTRSSLLLSEEQAYDHGGGMVFPNANPLHPLRAMMTLWIPRAMEILQLIGSHNLLAVANRYTLNDARLRPLIDKYMTGTNGHDADERARVFRLAWDFVGSGLAGRQELYERFYIGSGRNNRKALHMMQNMASTAYGYNLDKAVDEAPTLVRAKGLVDDILSRGASPHLQA